MHVAKTLREAIANGYAIGRQADVQERMRIALTNFLKRKFGPALLAACDKPLGPEEINALLTEILAGGE